MQTSTRSQRRGRRARTTTAFVAAALTLGGLAGCGDTGADDRAATADDLDALEQDYAALEERVGALEQGLDTPSPDDGDNALPGVGLDDLLTDPQSFLGQEVTVTGEVSQLWTADGSGAAFRLGGDVGDPIAVVAVEAPDGLDGNDDVEVTGTVTSVSPDTFEEEFGTAADDVLADPDDFFGDTAGEPAISAERVEILAPSEG